MTAIFYDLETTDLCPIGQILNCCFIAVDTAWNEIGRLELNVHLSPLQLPSPEAVLKNRTRVLDHQNQSPLREHVAMRQIHSFICDQIDNSPQGVELIGYNSARFDLNFLRTSMIRNGLNPYFFGRIVPRDLLHGSKFLSASDQSFPRNCAADAAPNGRDRLSLSLETLTRAFGLLDGSQAHHSHDDVELSIELAKLYHKLFGFDIRSTPTYSADNLHRLASQHGIVAAISPQYELTSDQHGIRAPYALLHHDKKNGLWVNLKQYREGSGRNSVHWFSQNSGALFIEPDKYLAEEYRDDAASARQTFRDLNVNSFFPRSRCDIEADIYRLSFDDIRYLSEAIWTDSVEPLQLKGSDDARSLHLRHKLALVDWHSSSAALDQELLKYARYRYGGGCNVSKSCLDTLDPGIEHPAAHPTLQNLVQRIDAALAAATAPEDRAILTQLKQWYDQSPIMRVAGRELLAQERAPRIPILEQPEPRTRPRDVDRGGLTP